MKINRTGRYSQDLKKRLLNRSLYDQDISGLRAGRAGLAAEDRALLAMVLEAGSTFEQIARLRGEHPTTISRRFRQLVRRSRIGSFARAVAGSGRFDTLETAILIEYFLRGTTQKDIMTKLNTNRYRVRKTIARLTGQLQATHTKQSISKKERNHV